MAEQRQSLGFGGKAGRFAKAMFLDDLGKSFGWQARVFGFIAFLSAGWIWICVLATSFVTIEVDVHDINLYQHIVGSSVIAVAVAALVLGVVALVTICWPSRASL